ARDDLERVGAVDRGDDLVAGIGQRPRGQRAQRLLVLRNEDTCHCAQDFSTTPTNGSSRNACATSMPQPTTNRSGHAKPMKSAFSDTARLFGFSSSTQVSNR